MLLNIDLYLLLLSLSFILLLVAFFFYLKQKEMIKQLYSDKQYLGEKLEESEKQKQNLLFKYTVLNTRYEEEIKSSNEKLSVLQDTKDELSREFKILANQIFEDKSKQFSYTQKEQFEILLKPFREQISNFSSQSREQFNVESKDRHLLKSELSHLKAMNKQLSQDATNLADALKGDNKTQGNWGEIILERILEESGLRNGIEYKTQSTLESDEAKVYRPDVIIHMPNKRDVVIDSKVSLVAYERFMSEDDEELREKALKEHLQSIKNHTKELSHKEYNKLQGINTLDYVLLFMPIEGSFLVALNQDADFFQYAYDKNILVVSPSTLMVTLRTIEHIWRTQHQQDNATKIAAEAEAMYDKLVGFVEEMNNVGSYIQKTQDSYDKAINRLSSGRGNIIKRAQNMKNLGLKPTKKLPIKSKDDEE